MDVWLDLGWKVRSLKMVIYTKKVAIEKWLSAIYEIFKRTYMRKRRIAQNLFYSLMRHDSFGMIYLDMVKIT